eukprot:642277_1
MAAHASVPLSQVNVQNPVAGSHTIDSEPTLNGPLSASQAVESLLQSHAKTDEIGSVISKSAHEIQANVGAVKMHLGEVAPSHSKPRPVAEFKYVEQIFEPETLFFIPATLTDTLEQGTVQYPAASVVLLHSNERVLIPKSRDKPP